MNEEPAERNKIPLINKGRYLRPYTYAFLSAFFTIFFLWGRDLPKLPNVIFPFLVRLSPLPMFMLILKCKNKKKQETYRFLLSRFW